MIFAAPSASEAAASDPSALALSTSKRILRSVPGSPRRANGFPAALALSPDGRYAAMMNDGFGTAESGFRQSLAVLDLETDRFVDFPDKRLGPDARQSFFLGLQFGSDGKRLFASMASMRDPAGEKTGDTGNGIAVYSFDSGKIVPSGFLKIPPQKLAAGKIAAAIDAKLPPGTQIPYPAGLAVVPGPAGDRLVVADNWSDDAVLLDADSGAILRRFNLSVQTVVPGSYPYAVAATKDGKRAYVSLWNASRVAELDLQTGAVARMIPLSLPAAATAAGSHPTALLLSPDETRLFVALSNSDEVAVIGTKEGRIIARISAQLPSQSYLGAYPNALAQSADGSRLYVADAGINAVAVVDVSRLSSGAPAATLEPSGFIPTEWYPSALTVRGNDLLIANAKGRGAGPNDQVFYPMGGGNNGKYPYILELMHGSLARLDRVSAEKDLPSETKDVVADNLLLEKARPLPFLGGKSPIHHVIYIIKENRTYDQVLGDLKEGDGDPSLVMFGEEVTPNQHRIAREFGILDNFYASGEVSGDGHDWSTAGIASDYLEKTLQISYRDERTYDYEGTVAQRVPLDDGMPDVNEAGTGYIWTNVARHGLSYRHYGEFVATSWCDEHASAASPREGTPSTAGAACARPAIKKGEALPGSLGEPPGSPSPWPWPVPMIAGNRPTKPELRGHFDPAYADFNLAFPDQLRADEFLGEFDRFVWAKKIGHGEQLPAYVLLRLPDDHTSGTKPGRATPAAAVADNDLAVGRVVEAVSNSPYWDDTAILIVEDDAQNGPDHVDSHRSPAYVVSKYAPLAPLPYRDDHFYTSVAMIRTLETLLDLPPMNVNDAYSPWIVPLFGGPGTHAAFRADYRNRDNGLIYEMNPPKGPDSAASNALDFSGADKADSKKLNEILWRNRKGRQPIPPIKGAASPSGSDPDD